MKETEVRRTETNAPGMHAIREERTTTTSSQKGNADTLPHIVGAGVKNRQYGKDHVVSKQQVRYFAPLVLAVLLALTLLYLRSHEMFPWRHTPTLQEKINNQYSDLSNKAGNAAQMAKDSWVGGKAAGMAKDGAEWLAKSGINEKVGEYADITKEKLGDYAGQMKDTMYDKLNLGKEEAARRAKEAADRGFVDRAKDWVGDKVTEASDSLGNKVGSVTEDIKHRVEELREDARHATEMAKEEARHAAAAKTNQAGSTYNDAKIKAHDTKRSLKDAAAQKIAEYL